MKKLLVSLVMLLACVAASKAQTPDPNFHIYLCFGQSNMEGNAQIENIDRRGIDDRFQMMAAVDFQNPSRQMYNWYKAVPPLVRQNTGLTPVDYFGRTMTENLPEDVRIGVIVVAIGGCKIEHLDKDFDPATLANEADWFKSYMSAYDNKPYARILACAKEAQKQGVIKGMLLHQGCSNNGDQQWPNKVKKIYEDLLSDLELNAEDVPIFAGQVVASDMGGVCGGMNAIINKLPKTIPTAHVISSANLPQKGDGLHFTSHGYRVLGCRYATKALQLMGIEDPVVSYSEEEPVVPTPQPSEGDFVFDFNYFKPTIWADGTFDEDTHTFVAGQWGFGGWEYDTPIDLSGYQYLVAELEQPQTNGAEFRVFDKASYWEQPYSRAFQDQKLLVCELNGMMKNLSDGSIVPLNTSEVYRVGFWAYGGQPIVIKQVFATNNDPYNEVEDVAVDAIDSVKVYNLQGMEVLSDAENDAVSQLPAGIYIVNGKKCMKK